MKIKSLLFKTLAALTLLNACTQESPDPYDPVTGNPDQSVNFIVTASMDQTTKISLSWNAQPGNPSYQIFRAFTDDPFTDPSTLTFKNIGETKNVAFEDQDVAFNAFYLYKVKAQVSPSKSVESLPIVGRTLQPSDEELAGIAYSRLAEGTGGKRYDANSPDAVVSTIQSIIKENAGGASDVFILIDDTGSMGDDIVAVKKGVNNIINALPASARFGVATYNDLICEPTLWYKFVDLSSDYGPARNFVNAIKTFGGCDLPESVYDGVYETVTRATWKNQNRIMIVVGDAPPLEGTKTVHSYQDVAAKCQQAGVAVNLYPILITEDEGSGN